MSSLELVGTATVNTGGSYPPLLWPGPAEPGDLAVLALWTAVPLSADRQPEWIMDHDIKYEGFAIEPFLRFRSYHAILPPDFFGGVLPVGWQGLTTGFHFLYEAAALAVYRNVDVSRVYLGDDPENVGPADPFLYPGQPSGDRTKAAALVVHSWSTGAVAGFPHPDSLGNWDTSVSINGGKVATTIYQWDTDGEPAEIIPPGSFLISGTGPSYGSIALALAPEIQNATRQFPRDDSLGLGSAPRLYPPLRRGRVVGGFQ